MRLDKIRISALVFLFSFIWTGCMAVEQTSNDSAMKLVKAMRIDEIIIFVSKRPFLVGPQAATNEDVDVQRYLTCLDGVDRSAIRAGFTERIADKFTSSELLEALEFYDSEVGKKFVARTLALLPEHMGIPQPSGLLVEELGDIARNRVDSFVRSTVGKKIVTEGFFSSPEIALPALQIMQKRVEWCQSQPR